MAIETVLMKDTLLRQHERKFGLLQLQWSRQGTVL